MLGIKNQSKDHTCKRHTNHFNSVLCKGSDYKINIIEKLDWTGNRDPMA